MERRERDKQARAQLQAEREPEPTAPLFAAPVKVVSSRRDSVECYCLGVELKIVS